MRFFGLKTCDTCKKALKALDGQSFDAFDVRADGVNPTDLAAAHGQLGAALMNTRSTTWRGLDEAARDRDPLELLAEHPTLIKRPLIERDGVWTVGWTADVQKTVLEG
ncbi:arsenate reductase family protein [Thalassobium sp. R2A62]|jgi:arsenate reductase (glutaredoxin)|uniref:arsenate reductase family protein n=1 Tax=Thalassobium sp. R2A62 TaxID=633131 RepID=UPI0001B1D02A|nr:ArsC/Spx/MgsR family protein [Thalassobium sp. R2A62]EET46765.1 ArsC family protein [Thalassobium sp. R2A62]MDG1338843.1 ArsC/Spx/MgsR family protein [Paracoccaceae bacterium]MDG2451885.1 ArsC/Spx/MgsR family protein [Paracoccaceae bacterium]